MGRTWGDRAGLPCVVPGVPSPGAGDAADMRPGVGAGAGRWGFAGSCGTAQGASISRWSRGDSRGGVGAAEVARSTSPLQAGRRAESSDGSGSGAAPREAGGRKRVGEGPAAPRQSPSPFPFGCSDVAGAAGSGRAPWPFAPALSPWGLHLLPGHGGRGRRGRRSPWTCRGFASPRLPEACPKGHGCTESPRADAYRGVSNAERPTEGF